MYISPFAGKFDNQESPAEHLKTIVTSFGSVVLDFVISANEYALLSESEVKTSKIADSRIRSGCKPSYFFLFLSLVDRLHMYVQLTALLERSAAQTLGVAVAKLLSSWNILAQLCGTALQKIPSTPPPLRKIIDKVSGIRNILFF